MVEESKTQAPAEQKPATSAMPEKKAEAVNSAQDIAKIASGASVSAKPKPQSESTASVAPVEKAAGAPATTDADPSTPAAVDKPIEQSKSAEKSA